MAEEEGHFTINGLFGALGIIGKSHLCEPQFTYLQHEKIFLSSLDILGIGNAQFYNPALVMDKGKKRRQKPDP